MFFLSCHAAFFSKDWPLITRQQEANTNVSHRESQGERDEEAVEGIEAAAFTSPEQEDDDDESK